MADTTTTNLVLTKPENGASDNTWGAKLNTDMDILDLAIGTHNCAENSASHSALNFAYKAGRIMDGITPRDVAAGTVALTNTATNYIEITPSTGAVSANTTGFTAGRIPLFTAVTAGGAITTVTDKRAYFAAQPGQSLDITATPQFARIGLGVAADANVPLTLQKAGTAKANLDIFQLTNSGNAADMDGTSTSILFNQYYYDAATPAIADAARITVGTETDWTSTASTQDAYMAFSVALDGTITERMRITSAGLVGIGMTPAYTLDVTGNCRISTGFGCNGATPQTAYVSGGALAAYVTGGFGLDSDVNMQAMYTLVTNMRAALVANGIMS